jgi:hypothetical protein
MSGWKSRPRVFIGFIPFVVVAILCTTDGYDRYVRGDGMFIYTMGILEIRLLVGIGITAALFAVRQKGQQRD